MTTIMIISGVLTILGSGAFVGTVAWVLQLGNRVTKLETKQEDLPTLLDTKFDEVNRRLDRIERGMNGFLHGVN